jgi:hypothetical protein
LVCFVQTGVYGYRDKKVVGVFVHVFVMGEEPYYDQRAKFPHSLKRIVRKERFRLNGFVWT